MDSSSAEHEDPFADYHRSRRRAAAVRTVVGLSTLATIVLASVWLATLPSGSATAQPIAAPAGPTRIASMSSPASSPTASPVPTTHPTTHPTPHDATASAPRTAPATGAHQDVRITITATGYQHELDECQWVRMDLGAEAPIVGAHTQCGGAVVLTLSAGQFVDLTGEGLTGRYVVTDSRNAHSGDVASTALAGMNATVVLQTCYPGSGGRERLVGLEPA